jgi:hypothetical protein
VCGGHLKAAAGRAYRTGAPNKEQWLNICATQPAALIDAARLADVGPLQAMIDEIEYNCVIVKDHEKPAASYFPGYRFEDSQFL